MLKFIMGLNMLSKAVDLVFFLHHNKHGLINFRGVPDDERAFYHPSLVIAGEMEI